MKNILFLCFLLLNTLPGYAQNKDTMEVHFGLNNTNLAKKESDKIDKFISKGMLTHGRKLIVLGYADYLGGNEYNEALSNARAKSVKEYLISSGFDQKDITLCTGKGEIERAPVSGKGGYANDRKVLIITEKPPPQAPPVVAKPKVQKDLSHLETNETIALKDILFEGGTDQLLPKSFPELEKLSAFLLEHNTVKIQIEGHICCMMDPTQTDDMGPDGHSPLSERRAKAIYLYLVSKGIYQGRMKVVGLGSTKPLIKPELTDADREANRRVEIRILSK